MNARTAVHFGITGQLVEFYPPEALEGRPTGAPTVKVYAAEQSNDDTPIFTPTATLDATSLSTSAASGYAQHAGAGGRRRIFLSSTTGLATRRRYLLQSATSRREVVNLQEISANAYVDTEHDLGFDYPTSSALLGIRVTWPVDATWIAADENINDHRLPYRVSYRYTVDGVERQQWHLLDMVRFPARSNITIHDLTRHIHDLAYQENQAAFEGLVEASWRRLTRTLRGHGVDPNGIVDDERDELHVLATLLEWAEAGNAPPGRDPERYRTERSRLFLDEVERLVQGGKLRTNTTDGSGTAETVKPLLLRR